MRSLELDAVFTFGRLDFSRFVPDSPESRLTFRLKDRYCLTLSAEETRSPDELLPRLPPIPPNDDDRKKRPCLSIGRLHLDVVVQDVPEELFAKIEANATDEQTEAFGLELYQCLLQTYNGIVDFFRNRHGQYWLQYGEYRPDEYQLGLNGFDVRRKSGEWRIALMLGPQTMHVKGILNEGVSAQDWRDLSTALENGQRADVLLALCSNAFAALDERDYRQAVVEAVIAWEAALSRLLPKVVARQLSAKVDLDEQLTAKVIEGLGVRLASEVFMKTQTTVVSEEDRQVVYRAVELRNGIVHGRRFKDVPETEAETVVWTIKKTISKLMSAVGTSPSEACGEPEEHPSSARIP